MRLRTLSRRKQRGTRLAKLLDPQNVGIRQAELPHFLGIQMNDSLQPVPVLNRQLKQRHDSSAACQGLLPEIGNIHRHLVFVPLDIAMSESEIDRLGAAIIGAKPQFPQSLRYSAFGRQPAICLLPMATSPDRTSP
jgi:hypothetical protein